MKKNLLLLLLFLSFSLFSQEIPKAKIADMSGNLVDFEKLVNSDKPVIVSFWATWCMPCRQEMNDINKEFPKWQKEFGVKFLAISLDNNRRLKSIPQLIKRKEWKFDFYHDVNYELAKAYNIKSIPYMLIYKKGKLIYTHMGYSPGMAKEIYEIIKKK